MISGLHPKYYRSDEIYEEEKTQIFYKTWQFVGFSSQLKHHNDFVTLTLGNKHIVVQNFQGQLKALSNICTHRYAKIQNEPCGNRMLQCPYHAWIFNGDGLPVGVPCKETFEGFDKTKLALESYVVEKCGELVFVNIDKDPASLKDSLGAMYGRFKAMAEAMDKLEDVCVREVECNWKVFIENSLEGYHVGSVHPRSIATFGIGLKNTSSPDAKQQCGDLSAFDNNSFYFSSPHSCVIDAVGDEEKKKWGKVKKLISEFYFEEEQYSQHQIWPNMNIATFYGAAFFLQVIRPISAQKSIITHYLLSSKVKDNAEGKRFVYSKILEAQIAMGKIVLDEDVDICLKAQRGLSLGDKTGVLSSLEERVLFYQNNYKKYMDIK